MQRLACLDGLRGALACYVMASHMAPFALMPHAVAALLSHGGAAVDVFFILSGLVIVRSLDGTGWRGWPFLIARIARIFPAYLPMLALAVAVQPLPCGFEAMPWIAPDSPARSICSDGWPRHWDMELLAHLTMTHGLFPTGLLPDAWVSFLGAAWSLSTEWQFYVLVLALGRVGFARSAGARSLGPLVAAFMSLALAGLCWRLTAAPDWQFSRAFLPYKAQYFALGISSAGLVAGGGWRSYGLALAATMALSGPIGAEKLIPPLVWTLCLAAEHGFAGRTPSRIGALNQPPPLTRRPAISGQTHGPSPISHCKSWVVAASATMTSGAADVHLQRPRILLGRVPAGTARSASGDSESGDSESGDPGSGDDAGREPGGANGTPALVLTPVLALARYVLSSPVMVWFGGLSYTIYLTNEPVQKLLGIALARIVGGDGGLFTLFWCPLALVLPVLLAAWLHRGVELPAMRWSQTFVRRGELRTPSPNSMRTAR